MKPGLFIIAVLLACSPGLLFGQSKGMPFHKSYYLTPEAYLGDEVELACADGFHFASVWEIRDTSIRISNVQLGLTTEDSGSGPPVHRPGWVRVGDTVPNCDVWTTSVDRLGSVGALVPEELFALGEPPQPPPAGADGRDFNLHPCWVSVPMWCASD